MGETIVIQCYCFIEFKYKLAEIEKRVVRYEDVFCSDFKFQTQGAYDNGSILFMKILSAWKILKN